MRYRLTLAAAAALVLSVSGLGAQETSVLEQVRGALGLPATVDSVRRRGGIPEEEIRVVLEEIRRRRMPAGEAEQVLEEADAAIREHGPVDNFGAFVQDQLAAGLRGQALAQAIREEHVRRGIGKGKRRLKRSEELDSADAARAGPPAERGRRPDAPGAQGRGRPDTTGGRL